VTYADLTPGSLINQSAKVWKTPGVGHADRSLINSCGVFLLPEFRTVILHYDCMKYTLSTRSEARSRTGLNPDSSRRSVSLFTAAELMNI